MSENPNETVAQRIVDEVGTQDLIRGEKLKKLQSDLSSGTITAQDWRLLAEVGQGKGSGRAKAH